jgi:hypothetical protein
MSMLYTKLDLQSGLLWRKQVDFATVIRHKFKILSTVPALRDLLGMGPADAEEKTQYATEFGFQIGAYSLINVRIVHASM